MVLASGFVAFVGFAATSGTVTGSFAVYGSVASSVLGFYLNFLLKIICF